MRLDISIRTRYILSVMFLLSLLIATTLFVIEQRERKAILNEQKTKGVLIARYIAQLNLRPFVIGDREGVEESVLTQLSDELLYVVFYDRNSQPFVAKSFASVFEDLYPHSNIGPDVQEEMAYFERKRIVDEETDKVFRILEIEIPIFLEESAKKWGSIKIGHSLEEMHLENQSTRLMLILIGLVGILIGVAGALFLANRVTGPLKKLVDGTVQISKGDFSQRIDIETHDEIGDLARSFNEMSRQLQIARKKMLEANKKLIQAEKLASIGRISASIAHEIRNPLTSVKLNIQKVLESEHLENLEKNHLEISREGISQIEKFIKEMLNFTRVTQLNFDRFSIVQVIDEAVKMMADHIQTKNIKLNRDFKEGIPHVLVDGDKLRQVLLNILQNSCDAIDDGGEIRIGLSMVERKQEKKIRIEISDSGCGIAEGDWETVFEPFYTTKSSGIGLGLANARKIIEHHNGSIKVIKREDTGSAFEIIIPLEVDK